MRIGTFCLRRVPAHSLRQRREQLAFFCAVSRDIPGNTGVLNEISRSVQGGVVGFMGFDRVHLLKHLLERNHRSCYTEER